ncbi:BrnT family toxin [Rhizobium wenxiniae]|uniref:BrnT family toxin n=1 Tax=Rhizobium wenxiniae TaxID=1737357 RepID=UPI001C6F0B6B|nr:BrnT family toxin [Rhizobium wenxiniae]MBW9086522.1 BrnT family toxin [Rhizobium wenxiniae]
MSCEFDPEKSASNKKKHGIDFIEAQALWLDDHALTVPAKSLEGERRFARIGKIGDKVWAMFYTVRRGSIRIISVRRARLVEVRYYEDNHSRGTR